MKLSLRDTASSTAPPAPPAGAAASARASPQPRAPLPTWHAYRRPSYASHHEARPLARLRCHVSLLRSSEGPNIRMNTAWLAVGLLVVGAHNRRCRRWTAARCVVRAALAARRPRAPQPRQVRARREAPYGQRWPGGGAGSPLPEPNVTLYNAWPPQDRHQPSQSYLVRQPMVAASKNPAP